MGVSLFVALVYIPLNFVVDILYGFIDPRIRVADASVAEATEYCADPRPRRLQAALSAFRHPLASSAW